MGYPQKKNPKMALVITKYVIKCINSMNGNKNDKEWWWTDISDSKVVFMSLDFNFDISKQLLEDIKFYFIK